MTYFYWLIFLLLSLLNNVTLADPLNHFEHNNTYQVCFTPGDNCLGLIINALDQAKTSIQMQAFSFTAKPIAKALIRAQRRGVNVQLIVDKQTAYPEPPQRKNLAQYLVRQHIKVWVDDQPAIAHNKVIIIDGKTLLTGSFNFTYAAQEKNAENILLINDNHLAETYAKNWQQRLAQSSLYHSS